MIRNFVVSVALALSIFISFFFINSELNEILGSNNTAPAMSDIYLNYTNEETNTATMRYKYLLNYKISDGSSLVAEYDYSQPVFSLSKDGRDIAHSMANVSDFPLIPEYSNVFVMIPGSEIKDNFDINVNPVLKDIKKDIRFEVTIILEELINKRWTSVYQVVFMERGPYCSITKGPIEKVKKEWL